MNTSTSSEFSEDLVIGYIDDVLSAITNKGLRSETLSRKMKLRDMMEPVASDFPKLLEGISQGANMFLDQQSSINNLSVKAQAMSLDVLKGVGNAHWAAVGLLAIASVLERLDKISTNDRECIELLRGMLHLAKFVKMLKDMNADFHRETLGKMSDALHLIVNGAILCHSFIRCNKIFKFVLTKKINEELVYLRGKADRMKSDIDLHMNYMIACSVTFHLPREKQSTDDGRQHQQHSDDTAGEIKQICETETPTVDPDPEHATDESSPVDNSNKKNIHKPVPPSPTKIASIRYPVHKDSSGLEQFSSFAVQHGLKWLPIRFTFDELLIATNRFQDHLGHGGFGNTYKGTLMDGREVMIKRSQNNASALLNELVHIVNLHHRNILKLVGFCITGEAILVYDYMPKGNLSDLLFDPSRTQPVEWSIRMKILLGVINAVVYLHQNCIVHRDINPDNILLDESFNAKISAFGIAKTLNRRSPFGDGADDGDMEKHFASVAGTSGYIDPEYCRTCSVSRKSDIFSFGMLLFNVVSGRKYLDSTNSDGMQNLMERAFSFQSEDRVMDLVDSHLVEGHDFDMTVMLRIIDIGLWCIQTESNRRPSASRVLAMLSTKELIPAPPDPSINIEYLDRLKSPQAQSQGSGYSFLN